MSGFSLPTQRCFCTPRNKEPSENTFLCLRRGVSQPHSGIAKGQCFSLPTQRCFYAEQVPPWIPPLFSAYAEVFPLAACFLCSDLTFLCLRRGVSLGRLIGEGSCGFSLPTQRCFLRHSCDNVKSTLFSAYAEVFLSFDVKGSTAYDFSLPTQRCFRPGHAPA